jgi:hypothetical protein
LTRLDRLARGATHIIPTVIGTSGDEAETDASSVANFLSNNSFAVPEKEERAQ